MRDSAPSAWSDRARRYDLFEASEWRRAAHKTRLFGRASGRTLLVAAGTGVDLPYLPARVVHGIDSSEAMLQRARRRVAASPARVTLSCADACHLPFVDHSFDSVIFSCTLCSVPAPDVALTEARRVLAPGGRLLMFEHVRSRHWALGLVLDVMTLWTQRTGTAMNRDTVAAARRAGFVIRRVESVFLDIILAVEAERTSVDSVKHEKRRDHPDGRGA